MSKKKLKSGPSSKAPTQAKPASAKITPSNEVKNLTQPEPASQQPPAPVEVAPPPPADLEETTLYIPGWSERLGGFALEYKWWLVGAVVVLAAILRFWRLDYRSIWYDESFSLTLASRDLPTMLSGTANDYHPPLYYLLLGGWTNVLGNSVYTGRLFSAMAGIGFVAVVYGLGKELFGSRTALLAALFAAVAPFQLLYSQEVRHYSFQALLGTWTVWAFYRAWKRNSWLEWGHFALSGVVSLYNLYFSIFGLLLLDLFFVGVILYSKQTAGRWDWSRIKGWVGANVAIGLLYAPWAIVLVQRAGQVKKSYWIDTPNPLEIFRLSNIFLFNATNLTTDPPFAALGLLLGALITFFLLYSLRFRLKRGDMGKRRRSFEIALLLTYWLGVVALVLVISYVFAPIYLERSLIGVSAAFYLLLARVIQTARRPAYWLLLLIPGLIALFGSLGFYYFSREYTTHYENDQAASQLKANYKPGDVTLHSSKLSYQPFAYLKAPGPQFVAPEEPGNIHDDLSPATLSAIGMAYTPVSEALAQVPVGGRLWFVRTEPQPGQTDQYIQSMEQLISKRYVLAQKWDYWGLSLYLYIEPRA